MRDYTARVKLYNRSSARYSFVAIIIMLLTITKECMNIGALVSGERSIKSHPYNLSFVPRMAICTYSDPVRVTVMLKLYLNVKLAHMSHLSVKFTRIQHLNVLLFVLFKVAHI